MTVDTVALATLRVLQEKGNTVSLPSLAGNSTFFPANYTNFGQKLGQNFDSVSKKSIGSKKVPPLFALHRATDLRGAPRAAWHPSRRSSRAPALTPWSDQSTDDGMTLRENTVRRNCCSAANADTPLSCPSLQSIALCIPIRMTLDLMKRPIFMLTI